jgi:transposase
MARAAAPALALTAFQRSELLQLTRLPSTPQSIVLRARIVLGAADGVANQKLAARLETTRMTVLLWRSRYQEYGLVGILADHPRPGRPKEISPEEESEIVEATRSTKPKNATHWTVRTMALRQGVSPASVHRIWQAYGLQPHRVETFKFSNDPEFVHKVRDILGLYMNPPDKALVLSVDEKSEI